MKCISPSREVRGTLYVVSTPIGNLEDITLRALRILKQVNYIASEDTRRTRKLLAHFDIHVPLISYFREKERERAEELVAILEGGFDVALVTDAGTPCISDPGSILVQIARERGVQVISIPGPSSLTAALSVSGFAISSFLYLGFPPARKTQRLKFFSNIASETHLLVFFESPHRLIACLEDCAEIFGERHVFVGRELTKLHEECLTGELSSLLGVMKGRDKILGEAIVVMEGARESEQKADEDEIVALLRHCRDEEGMTLRDGVRHACRRLGVSRSEVYKRALFVWKNI